MSNIKLSCNYVSELKELINEGKIDVDYVKFPAINADMTKLEEAIAIKTVMFHGFPPYTYFLNLGGTDVKSLPVDELREAIKRTGTPHISAHLGAAKTSYPDYDGSVSYKNKILNVIIDNIVFIKNNVDVPFLGENTFCFDSSKVLDICEDPEFVYEAVNQSGCGYIFDITHAMISAEHSNMSFNEYIKRLPMDKTVEIHLSGSDVVDGHINDLHGKINDNYYEILEHLLKSTPAKYVTLEYMTKTYDSVNPQYKNDLYEQLVRLKEIINKY